MAEAALSDEPGTFVPVSFKVAHELRAHETRSEARGPRRAARGLRGVRRAPRPLPVDWRHALGLAGPGPLPRAHRRAGSLGDGQRLRRDHRQDEEPVLRDAQHACAAPLRHHPVRPHPVDNQESKLSSASGSASTCSMPPQPPFRGPHQRLIYRPRSDDPRLGAYRHIGDHQWLRARKLFVAEGRFVVERLLTLSAYEIESVNVTPPAFEALRPVLESLPCDVFICDPRAAARPHRIQLSSRLPRSGAASRPTRRWNRSSPRRGCSRWKASATLTMSAGFSGRPRRSAQAVCCSIRRAGIRSIERPFVRRWEPCCGCHGGVWTDGWTICSGSALPDSSWLRLTPVLSATSLHEFASATSSADRLLLLLGAEGSGLTPATLEISDIRVRIPVDMSVDSLNVVVAASIALERLS